MHNFLENVLYLFQTKAQFGLNRLINTRHSVRVDCALLNIVAGRCASMDAAGGQLMPSLISGSRLKEAVEGNTFIQGGDPSSVEAVKYDFHIGSTVLKAEYGQPVKIDEIPQEKRSIYPGEVAFVLTRERLKLPNNIIATLTPKRKLAHDGIIVLGGLAVDPKYCGVLLIGLYNFSSTPFPLRAGKKLIGAVFYELGEDELVQFPVADPTEMTDFPDDLVRLIGSYKPVELTSLQEALNETRRELVALKSDFSSDKSWKEDFKKGLDEHNRQLGELIKGLERETTVRAQDDKAIGDRLTSMSNLFFGLKLGWAAFAAVVLVVVSVLAGMFIPRMFAEPTPPSVAMTPIAPPIPQLPPSAGAGTRP